MTEMQRILGTHSFPKAVESETDEYKVSFLIECLRNRDILYKSIEDEINSNMMEACAYFNTPEWGKLPPSMLKLHELMLKQLHVVGVSVVETAQQLARAFAYWTYHRMELKR